MTHTEMLDRLKAMLEAAVTDRPVRVHDSRALSQAIEILERLGRMLPEEKVAGRPSEPWRTVV